MSLRLVPHAGLGRVLVLAALFAASLTTAAPAAMPLPESSQCETTRYLIGLRQQGLFFLQAEYMKTYPAGSPAEARWFEREATLARALQGGLAIEGRLPLLSEADGAAVRAIELEPESPRSLLWRADRAQTWYYLAGRPLFEQVIFYGPTPALRRGLRDAADRGDQAYDQALTAVAGYLDQISEEQNGKLAADSRKLNISGFGLNRQLQFEHAWVTLYKAAVLNRGDVDQAILAGEVLRSLQEQQLLQDAADARTPAQIEALFMAGVASRLQTDWPAAQGHLEAAGRAVAALPPGALPTADWVGYAAVIETIRVQIDQGQFQEAATAISRQREQIDSDPRLDPTVKLARKLSLAMLNFEACSLAADAAAAEKNRTAQAAFSTQRFDALARLAVEAPDARQAIYQLVADRLGDVATVASLPPFAKAVFAARWIRERKFPEALAAAEALQRETAERKDFLNQDALCFKALCQQELKQSAGAAQSYIQFARDYPADKRVSQVLLSALSQLARQEDVLDDAASRAALVELGDLLQRTGGPEIEKYKANWLPLVAEANLRESRYDRAADLFQMIPKDSKQYGLAMVGRILAVSGKLRFASPGTDKERTRAQAQQAIEEAIQASKSLSTGKPVDTQPGNPDVQAAKLLLEAARLSLDALGDADRALSLLEGAETRWQNNPQLLAQLLNVRIHAFRKAGKVEQATQIVEQFMSARPEAAGPLLASLLGDMQREIDQQNKLGRAEQAEKYAILAAGLAEQLDKWAADHPEVLKPEQRYAIRYRMARALLQAGQAERALGMFDEMLKEDASRSGGPSKDAGVLEGRAASLFALQKWPEARQAYLDIWRRAQPRSEIWWQSILRSLQCSATLGDENPDKILKVIRQHKDLYPDMGGVALVKQFDALSFEMLKRLEAVQASQPARK